MDDANIKTAEKLLHKNLIKDKRIERIQQVTLRLTWKSTLPCNINNYIRKNKTQESYWERLYSNRNDYVSR